MTTIGTTTTGTNYYKLADLIDELRKLKDTINPQNPYNDFDKDIVLLAQADCRYSSINYLEQASFQTGKVSPKLC